MSDHNHDHDDWFRHSDDEAQPQEEHAAQVNTTAIGLTLLALVFGVLFTVVILSMYFVNYANTRKAEMNEGTGSARAFLEYRDQSEAMLSASGWADRAAGKVNLPISDAMDSVVEQYNTPGMRADAEWRGSSKPAAADLLPGGPHDVDHQTALDDSMTEEHAPADG